MAYHSGVFVWDSSFCTSRALCTDPNVCNSHCVSNNSNYYAAMPHYYDCKGLSIDQCNSISQIGYAPGFCPVISIYKCNYASVLFISVMDSTKFGCKTTSVSGCTHGHTGKVRYVGCLNRAALNALGAGASHNKMWTKFVP
jgi:hypothetical protein